MAVLGDYARFDSPISMPGLDRVAMMQGRYLDGLRVAGGRSGIGMMVV
jgi:hypothetical protein